MCAARARVCAEEAWQCIPKKQRVMKRKEFIHAFTIARVQKFEENVKLKKAVSRLHVQQGYDAHRRIKWREHLTVQPSSEVFFFCSLTAIYCLGLHYVIYI